MTKRLTFIITSIALSLLIAIMPLMVSKLQVKNITTNLAIRTIDLEDQTIDYENYFKQFKSVNFVPDEKLSTLNLVQNVDDEFLSEINNNSLTNYSKGEVSYDIEYDHENNKVFLNATIYLDDEGNCLLEQIEGVACWNDDINDIDIVFESEDGVVLLSEFNDTLDNCGWFRKALKFIKKNAVAIVATVAVVAVVATVAVAAPAFIAAATATMSVGGSTAAAAGGISAGLVAAGSAIASSTLVSAAVATAAVATGVVLTACALDTAITLTDAYVTDFADSVLKTNRADRYILVILSALDQPFVTHYKPVDKNTAKTWFSLGGQVWTPYSTDAIALINECGYAAGNSRGEIGVAEHNIISLGVYGYYHYHALNPITFEKVRLPGDGVNASAIQAHAMHCFFYF